MCRHRGAAGDTAGHESHYAVFMHVPPDIASGSTIQLPTLNTNILVQTVVRCPAGGIPAVFVHPIDNPPQDAQTLVASGRFHYPTP